MKKFKATVVAVILFVAPFSVFAQSTLDSSVVTNSTTQSVAGATNQGNAQSIHFNSTTPDRQTLRTAPSIGGNSFYGSFSSDNCMVSGGVSASFIGAGGSVVTPIRDPQCSLLRVYERTMQLSSTVRHHDVEKANKIEQAATDMLCQVSDEARAALAEQGLCTDLRKSVAVARDQLPQIERQTFAAQIEH